MPIVIAIAAFLLLICRADALIHEASNLPPPSHESVDAEPMPEPIVLVSFSD